jgi:hypothetical protein
MHVIFAYPHQKFIGIATRKPDKSLHHEGYALVDSVPRVGEIFSDRKVLELLTDEKLLKEQSAQTQNPIAALTVIVVVDPLGLTTTKPTAS